MEKDNNSRVEEALSIALERFFEKHEAKAEVNEATAESTALCPVRRWYKDRREGWQVWMLEFIDHRDGTVTVVKYVYAHDDDLWPSLAYLNEAELVEYEDGLPTEIFLKARDRRKWLGIRNPEFFPK